MADPAWKRALRPASFRGVPFKIDVTGVASGRRGQTYEFPKRDAPEDEDLGRRAYRLVFTGWVIGDDCLDRADALEAALIAEGAGRLIHPTRGGLRVRCESYSRTERRAEGGMVSFDLIFVEAPASSAAAAPREDTQAGVGKTADDLSTASVLSAGSDADWV